MLKFQRATVDDRVAAVRVVSAGVEGEDARAIFHQRPGAAKARIDADVVAVGIEDRTAGLGYEFA